MYDAENVEFKFSRLRRHLKDPILGSENWKEAFRWSDFKVPFCAGNLGRSFLMCSHDPILGTNKTRILKKNGSFERAFSSHYEINVC